MVQLDSFFGLLGCDTEEAWADCLYALARDNGFGQVSYGVAANKKAPLETTFRCSNYAPEWRTIYDTEKYHYIDPIVGHCLRSALPLVWDSATFKSPKEKQFYEEACGYGLRQGVSLPIHGTSGEFGVLSFVTDDPHGEKFQREMQLRMPQLALIRDFIFESSLTFATLSVPADNEIKLTRREIECLNWAAEGKSSWEISKIFRCAEVTVNFHFSNIRRKFDVNSRQQALVKAIRLGLICPD